MRKYLFFTSFIALIVTLTQGCNQSNADSNQIQVTQEPVVQSQTSVNKQESIVKSQNRNNQEPVVESQTSINKQESIVKSQNNRNNLEPIIESEINSNEQESIVESQNNRDMKIARNTTKSIQRSSSSSGYTSQQSSSSSGYQSSTLSLSRANLSKPHILSITTSGKKLTGKVVVNDKLVKKIYGNKFEFDLSPHLSVGDNTVEIDARYTPSSSNVDIEMNGPGTSVSQQNSGNGVVSSNINIVVR